MRISRIVALLTTAALATTLQTTVTSTGASAAPAPKNGNVFFAGLLGPDTWAVWQVRPTAQTGGPLPQWIDDSGQSGIPSYPDSVDVSADGSRVAYKVSTYPGVTSGGAVIIRDVASGNVVQVVEGIGILAQTGLSWSPDGESLVVSSQRRVDVVDLADELTTTVYDRSNRRIVINDVRWSPNGRQIAFTTSDDTVATIKLIRADGSTGKTVLSQPLSDGSFTGLDWSPDSTRLAYVQDQLDAATGVHTTALMTTDKQGEDVVDLSALAGGPEPGRYLVQVSWAPDGKRVAVGEYLSNAAQGQFLTRIRAYKADGSGRYWVTGNVSTNATPSFDWAPQLP